MRMLTVVENSVVASEIERVGGHVRREVCALGVHKGDVEICMQVGNPFRKSGAVGSQCQAIGLRSVAWPVATPKVGPLWAWA
jgi:hypothetical protein